ncbi:hypothetical protein RCL_jg17558.t1 [Rhizophagus clarus]|uniref:Uncharacterized protein n=1 Tax=Rhizophagus clarus TaxID=94130 RepID=A0A8H3KYR4_9GLOM|nr:hypothetical protein RCL_jg17558.t1 [Rhizophagus clarus]
MVAPCKHKRRGMLKLFVSCSCKCGNEKSKRRNSTTRGGSRKPSEHIAREEVDYVREKSEYGQTDMYLKIISRQHGRCGHRTARLRTVEILVTGSIIYDSILVLHACCTKIEQHNDLLHKWPRF